MNCRSIFTLSAIAAVGLLASLPSSAVAQQKSLKEQLIGTWTLVSCNSTDANGAKVPYCVNPKGILILDANGQYAVMIFAGGRSNATAVPSAANFGTWSVNEADKTITRHYVGALTPSNEGADSKYSVSLTGDGLKFAGQTSLPSGAQRSDLLFRRAK